jgi:hypothetical protein
VPDSVKFTILLLLTRHGDLQFTGLLGADSIAPLLTRYLKSADRLPASREVSCVHKPIREFENSLPFAACTILFYLPDEANSRNYS